MARNDLKARLGANQLTLGSWVTIGHPSIVEILASAGFDWLCVDMEHSAIELRAAQELICTIQGLDMAALVRVPVNEPIIIKRVMDAGADGVIVPMVNSAEQARAAVASVRYPPQGQRGVGLARAQGYGIGFERYRSWLAEESVVIVQIEHIDAVNDIEAILAVEGVDGTIIGPYDLSGSMGMPGEFHRPEVTAAVARVEAACQQHGVPLGYHVIEPDAAELQRRIDSGYRFVAFSIDFLFLGAKARDEMQRFREAGSE